MAIIRFGPLIDPRALAQREARYARELARETKSSLRATDRANRQLARQIEKEARAAEKANARDLARLKRFLSANKLKLKRKGHGLKKQLKEFKARPVFETKYRTPRDQLDAYAAKLDQAYGKPGSASYVENPGALFLSFPRDTQRQIFSKAAVRRREYLDYLNDPEDNEPPDYDFDPMIMYH